MCTRACSQTRMHAHTRACARASYCPLLCRWASFGPRGDFERFFSPVLGPGAVSRGRAPRQSPREPPSLGSRWAFPVPRVLQLGPGSGAEAWAGQAASPRAQGLGLRLPDGGSITFWPTGRPAGGFLGSGLFPPGSPAAHIPVYGPRAAPGGLQPGCWEIFIGVSGKMRAVGVLRAFRSRFIGAGLPDALGSSDFQGNLVSLLGSHPLASVFGLAAPGLACFDPHLVLGFCGLSVDEVARGGHSPAATGTQMELCVCGRQVEGEGLEPFQGRGEVLWSWKALRCK